ncbi:SDR family NAD(P)-dependent oxidoreductase [Corynebacterium falsenii]|uniref:SDR family oxidoreductase n=1 Tax=Corynebacterium falsenii TaxID=108486 RepID=A0A418Q590_9CORY|nr:glucose 1-dehydrogenase [Corynebacterium falsenii]MDC7104609.1 glucose 1-dehydrogenase [Corynebacterium falsenii]RIX33732.1 SDR family oxidoreductase [Corynebacterium falsenii]
MSNDTKVVAVTGAGDGIGRAIAERLGKDGYTVIVSDISEEKGNETVQIIKDAGGTADFVFVDAGKLEDNENLVKFALDKYGRLDAAVNNAGLGAPPAPLAKIDTAAFDRAMSVTLRGTFFGMHAQLDHFAEVGKGNIVNIISIGGLQATKNLSPYIAAKHGVVGLTETAALDYAEQGIRINGVAPGPIKTAALATLPEKMLKEQEDLVPLHRLGDPAEIAAAVSWLLSDEASFVTGVVLPVDGGAVLS